MEFDIFSIGDSEFLEQVMIALAMIAGNDNMATAIGIGLMLGVLGAAVSSIMNGGKDFQIQYVFVGLLIYLTMFVPTATINIEDKYTGDVRRVDNVPIGAAAAGGIISTVGFKLTELFEVAYGPIVPKVTNTQYAESLNVLSNIRQAAMSDTVWAAMDEDAGTYDLRTSWSNYINQCSLRKIDMGAATANDFRTQPWNTILEFDSTLFGTQLFLNSGAGEEVNCADGWDLLTAATEPQGANASVAFTTLLGFNASNLDAGGGENGVDKLNTSLAALLSNNVNSNDYMRMAVLEPLLMQATAEKAASTQDVNAAVMVQQAITQRNTQWAAEQSLFMTIVRPMLAFFEAFTYAIFPIAMFVIMLGQKGIQLATKYFALTVWIQLWLPLMAITNLYIVTAASREMLAWEGMGSYHWNSFLALNSAGETAASWIATGGMLAASTPALALMLIYGSAITATHLAGRLQGGDAINEKMMSPDLRSTGPVAQFQPQYGGDAFTGAVASGVKFPQINMTHALSNARSSAASEKHDAQESWGDALQHIQQSGWNSSIGRAWTSAAKDVYAGQNTQTQKAIDNDADALMKEQGNEQMTQEQARASVIMSAALKGTASASAPGPVKAGVGGEISGTSQGGDITTQQDGSSRSDTLSSQRQSSLSDEQAGQLQRSVAREIASSDDQAFSAGWSDQHSTSIQNSASELISTSNAYSTVDQVMSGLGSGISMDAREAAAQIANNPEAATYLSDLWKAGVPAALATAAGKEQARYESYGMPEDRAQIAGRLTAMTNAGNFGDSDTANRWAVYAGTAMGAATGTYAPGDFDPDSNRGVGDGIRTVDPSARGTSGADMGGALQKDDINAVSANPDEVYHTGSALAKEQAAISGGQIRSEGVAAAKADLLGSNYESSTTASTQQYMDEKFELLGDQLAAGAQGAFAPLPDDIKNSIGEMTFAYETRGNDWSNTAWSSSEALREATSETLGRTASNAGLTRAETAYYNTGWGYGGMEAKADAREAMYTEYGQRFGANGERTDESNRLADKAMGVMDYAVSDNNNAGALTKVTNLQGTSVPGKRS